MYLRRLQVSHFRGIQQVCLDLDETTVLIGENNTGKSSLLRAIDVCLGVDSDGYALHFSPEDFHREAGAAPEVAPPPIEIALHFAERERREWDEAWLTSLSAAIVPSRSGRREIALRVTATSNDGGIVAETTYLDAQGAPLPDQPPAPLLAELRRLSPFLLIGADRDYRRAAAVAEATDSPHPTVHDADEATLRELERRIEKVYGKLRSGHGHVPDDELEEGLDAVGEWLESARERLLREETSGGGLRELVRTPLKLARSGAPATDTRLDGSGPRSLGTLVVLASLLQARGRRRISREAHPIVAIEEPEAHLHPLMLLSAWALVSGFRTQKIVTTNSGELLAAAPLGALRRLARVGGETRVYQIGEETLETDEMRRVAYHVRIQRGGVFFARCWLLVEGQTEFWLLPELARLCGHDLLAEGVACIELAQCGPVPLVKLANALGIGWHLFVDGDAAGKQYAEAVRPHLGDLPEREHITVLRQPDLEHCLWRNGYEEIYREAAGGAAREHPTGGKHGERPSRVIEKAVRKRSKPGLALAVVQAAAEQDSPGVPEPIRAAVESAVRLARREG